MRINRNRIAIAASFVIIALMISSAASAFVLLSPARKWFSTPRLVHVDNGGLASVTDGSGGVNATLGAVTAWNNSIGGPTLNITDSIADTTFISLGDGRSNLEFSDPIGVCSGNCIAATFTGFYTAGVTQTCGSLTVSRIDDADVVFNTAFNFQTVAEGGTCSSEIYLESVVTHEIGHLIGLGHSSNSAALMFASVSFCVNKPLHSDDTAGRNALYNCSGGGECLPRNASCTTGSQCCSGHCKGNGRCR